MSSFLSEYLKLQLENRTCQFLQTTPSIFRHRITLALMTIQPFIYFISKPTPIAIRRYMGRKVKIGHNKKHTTFSLPSQQQKHHLHKTRAVKSFNERFLVLRHHFVRLKKLSHFHFTLGNWRSSFVFFICTLNNSFAE